MTIKRPITVTTLANMKARGEPIGCLTAYDYSFASILDKTGVEIILVGDSLGMVVQGHLTTLPVTVDDLVYHTQCATVGRSLLCVMTANYSRAWGMCLN